MKTFTFGLFVLTWFLITVLAGISSSLSGRIVILNKKIEYLEASILHQESYQEWPQIIMSYGNVQYVMYEPGGQIFRQIKIQ